MTDDLYYLFCDLYDDGDDEVLEFVEQCKKDHNNNNLTLRECFILAKNEYEDIIDYLNYMLTESEEEESTHESH